LKEYLGSFSARIIIPTKLYHLGLMLYYLTEQVYHSQIISFYRDIFLLQDLSFRTNIFQKTTDPCNYAPGFYVSLFSRQKTQDPSTRYFFPFEMLCYLYIFKYFIPSCIVCNINNYSRRQIGQLVVPNIQKGQMWNVGLWIIITCQVFRVGTDDVCILSIFGVSGDWFILAT